MWNCTFILAVIAGVLAALPAPAQQRQLPGTARVNGLMLLSRKPVQEDLKLTADQIQKIAEAAKKKNAERAGFQGLDQEERLKKQAAWNKESDKIATGILTPAQGKRLGQISLQQQGPAGALLDEGVARKLKLTDEQKQTFRDFTVETIKEVRKAVPPGGDREQARRVIAEFSKKLSVQMLALLTSEQKAKWEAMIGPPLKGELRGDPANAPRRPDGKD